MDDAVRKEYPEREIFRKGRYARCQVMTSWTLDPPKYIACNDLETGDQFLARQALGTWCEVDVRTLAESLRDNVGEPVGRKELMPFLKDNWHDSVSDRVNAIIQKFAGRTIGHG